MAAVREGQRGAGDAPHCYQHFQSCDHSKEGAAHSKENSWLKRRGGKFILLAELNSAACPGDLKLPQRVFFFFFLYLVFL